MRTIRKNFRASCSEKNSQKVAEATYEKIAEVIGCSPAAIKQRVYRNKLSKVEATSEHCGLPFSYLN